MQFVSFWKKSVFLFAFLFVANIHAQDYKKHTVAKGETITQIASKYKVTPYDIYNLNPDARNVLQENSVLLIPVKRTADGNFLEHEVSSGETLFNISKQYDLKVQDIESVNPGLTPETLKLGQVIKIPTKSHQTKTDLAVSENKTNGNIGILYHTVEPKDTLYAISKKYNVSIETLEKLNPGVSENLSIGYNLIIRPGTEKKTELKADKNETQQDNSNFELYSVAPKETLFSISTNAGISQEELIRLNPELKEGLKEGAVIKLPKQKTFHIVSQSKGTFKDLQNTINTSRKKELVFLMPFNISKIHSDTTLSIQTRLQKDSFLNMTLDYYSGVLMAIDSAKTIGLNIDVKIFDSQETRHTSQVNYLLNSGKLNNADVVIGPFYPNFVDKLASELENRNIPVVSPLRETTKSYKNLYESMPSADFIKVSMFDYIKSENGNMIVLLDKKKSSSKQFIQDHFKNIYISPYTESGGFATDSIMSRLSGNRTNYFILETASTNIIINAITQINKAREKGFSAELVVLDINATFETDEVFHKIIKQKIIFPSLSKHTESTKNNSFAEAYKKKNNIFPNQYAIRGFDVAFDTMLRMSQQDDFSETADKYITEQLEYKFEYHKKPNGGYVNKGVYIMQYGDDYEVKELKK